MNGVKLGGSGYWWLAVLAVMAFATCAEGAVWRVPSVECPTIQSGLNACSPNDSVLVEAGVYNESLVWPAIQGIELVSESGPLLTQIIGNPADPVILVGSLVDGRVKGFDVSNGETGVYLGNCRNISLDSLIIHDNAGHGLYAIGILDTLIISGVSSSLNDSCGIFVFPDSQSVRIAKGSSSWFKLEDFKLNSNGGTGGYMKLPEVDFDIEISNGESNGNSAAGLQLDAEVSARLAKYRIDLFSVESNDNETGLRYAFDGLIDLDLEVRHVTADGSSDTGLHGTLTAEVSGRAELYRVISRFGRFGLYTELNVQGQFDFITRNTEITGSAEAGAKFLFGDSNFYLGAYWGYNSISGCSKGLHLGFEFKSGPLDLRSFDIEHSGFVSNVGHGIECVGLSPHISNCMIVDNGGDGMYCSDLGCPTLRSCDIYDNVGYGLRNADGTVFVSATDNWWGDESGPGGVGPGSGDEVSAGISYEPWCVEPAAAELSEFSASSHLDHVVIEWESLTETDNAGFNVWRSLDENGSRRQLNKELIPAEGDPLCGGSYSYIDWDVTELVTYYYWLEDVALDGAKTMHGPVCATAGLPEHGEGGETLTGFGLSQNCPNPFSALTEIRYTLPARCSVRLTIYNASGQEIVTLVDGYEDAGYRVVKWDGCDKNGSAVSGGIYFCRLQSGGLTEVKKMALLR